MPTKQRTDTGNDRLLLFAPGYADPSLLIGQLSKKFTNGFDQVILNYKDRGITQTIPQIAQSFIPLIESLRDSYETIIFIGHSMGGLVGKEIAHEVKLDGYCSIATPHSGTNKAFLASWFSPAAKDMVPGSQFLRTQKHFDKKVVPKILNIAAQYDSLVKRPKLLGVETTKVPWTTHITVMMSQRTYLEVWGWLAYEVFNDQDLQQEPGYVSIMNGKDKSYKVPFS